jgi:hypothetical protein
MKKFIEGVINGGFKTKLKLLYGDNVKVIVEDYYWSRRSKNYTLTLIIYTDSIDQAVEIHPEGIEVIISSLMKMINNQKPIKVISSLKYKENGTPDTTC